MEDLKNLAKTKEIYNYELPAHEGAGSWTERVAGSSSVYAARNAEAPTRPSAA